MGPRSLNLLLEGKVWDFGCELVATCGTSWYRSEGRWRRFPSCWVHSVTPEVVRIWGGSTNGIVGEWKRDPQTD